jgi:hypothetical protein
MSNEQYLYISYFAAGAGGIVLAAITAFILKKPLRTATDVTVLSKLGKLLRRVFPAWLIVTVLFAFALVSYFDCSHQNYSQIAADRAHLVRKTTEQLHNIFMCSAIALTIYLGLFILFIWSETRPARGCKILKSRQSQAGKIK